MIYFLAALTALGAVFGALGVVSYAPTEILGHAVLFVFFCVLINTALAHVWRIAPNKESPVITGLILSLILEPVFSLVGTALIFVISLIAIASKYVLTVRKSHVLNPAAFGALASSFVFGHTASWWVGIGVFLPAILIGGFLVLMKMRRFRMVGVFLFVLTALFFIDSVFFSGAGVLVALSFVGALAWSPFILFFASVMLIEPLTSPGTEKNTLLYAGFVAAIFFILQKFGGGISYLIELSLLSGNIFAKVIEPGFRQLLTLAEKEKITEDIYSFLFVTDRSFAFLPGQYLIYTLPHKHPDNRGERRYFTIASSPAEQKILLTTKIIDKSSSFKHVLRAMWPGGTIAASHVGGDFILPHTLSDKLVFIAGGIGITPFRSMVRHLLDKGESRDIILLYGARTDGDIIFKDVFAEAGIKVGLKTIFVLSEETRENANYRHGMIDAARIEAEVPDFRERIFYVSGPEPMVRSVQKMLSDIGVPMRRIRRDYFPGYEERPQKNRA